MKIIFIAETSPWLLSFNQTGKKVWEYMAECFSHKPLLQAEKSNTVNTNPNTGNPNLNP